MYEALLREAEQQGLSIYEKPMSSKIKGLYADNVICINKNIPTATEKACILAEEMGHYHKTAGDILDQSDIRSRKQEKVARTWAYRRLIPLSCFVQAHRQGVRNRYELAQFLNVTECFLDESLKRYQEIYGTHTRYGCFTISFDPLLILELLD